MTFKNRKGFTLVELLSVIVILSVVVLIATNAVLPMMSSAKKQVLATEANIMIKQAYLLYTEKGEVGTKCISYKELLDSGKVDKNDEDYTGSFLIESTEDGKYNYKIWLSNGKNMIEGKTPDITSDDVTDSSEDASTVCGLEE